MLATFSAPLSDGAKSFLSTTRQLLIAGAWHDAASGETFEVEDPATAEIVAKVAAAGKEDVDRAVLAARVAFDDWSNTPPAVRARLLFKLADLIDQNAAELAELESLDVGKPLSASQTLDIPFAAEVIRYNAGWATKLAGETFDLALQAEPFHAFTLRQPVGVVVGITPWNFPLLQISVKLSAALAAGCVIILKPAEQTPLTAIRLGELVIEAGFPAGVIQVLTGFGRTVGAALVNHPGIDKISFTGSTSVGREIARNCANDFKRVTVELGGKSPNIIFDDADLNEAIPGSMMAAFFNTGQVCHAGTRLFIQSSIFDKTVAGIAEAAKNLRIGGQFDAETVIGPVVSRLQQERVTGYIDEAVKDGASIALGGRQMLQDGYFVEPTIIVGTHAGHKIRREEVFGPVVCAIPFDDPGEIVTQANDSIYGLAAGVWTRDISRAHKVARAIQSGMVWINCYHAADVNMPFGGFKQSGWGRELGRAGVEAFTEIKSVAVKL